MHIFKLKFNNIKIEKLKKHSIRKFIHIFVNDLSMKYTVNWKGLFKLGYKHMSVTIMAL